MADIVVVPRADDLAMALEPNGALSVRWTSPRAGSKRRVLILGGGFAGVFAARRLEKELGRRGDYEIVLVSKENYFVFQPMLAEVISGTIGLLDVVSPLRRLLPRTYLHVREIEAIDLPGRTVTTTVGFRKHPHVIHWDHLVIALGNVTDFRGLPGMAAHALPFKNLADAINLRNHVIRAIEEASIEIHDPALRRRLLTFVVAGGGFSGVEVVAELNDFVRHVASSYQGIDPKEIRVILVHLQDRILPEMPDKLALYAQAILQKRGVELWLNAGLSAATPDEAILSNGLRIATKTLVSTVPSSPHPVVDALGVPKAKNGRIRVTPELEVEGAKNVWAIGDCAAVPAAGGGISPPTAQHATRQAETVARNLVASIRGGKRQSFDFKGLGKMGSLGRRMAVAEILGVKLSGFVAWFIWRTIYLFKLPGWGRRAKVAASWTFDLFLPPELVRMRLGGEAGMRQEHFEPGQDVFREGEIGDRVYFIRSGRANVVRALTDGTEDVIASLEAGEFFGEAAVLRRAPRNATIRCAIAMDTLSLAEREFRVLAEHVPELQKRLDRSAEARGGTNRPPPPPLQALSD